MRVALISKAAVVGAYQTKFAEIAAYEDIDLTVIAPSSWRDHGRPQILERANTEGYRLVAAPVRFNGSFHLHHYPSLHSILAQMRPEIVHVDEEPYNLATYFAVRDARHLGARALFFTWQNLLKRYPQPFRTLERHVYRGVHAAIAGNQDAVDVLRQKGYRGIIRLIPQFGVDPSRFCPDPRDTSGRPFTIGYAGRLVPEKGLDVLADALAGLEGEWRLTICGAGPQRDPLERRFAARGQLGRVHFLDQISSVEMPRYLNQMDVLVLPSLTRPNWKEQFGRVLIEAMACQVPVVGSDSGEIPHVIGDAGLVFPEGDVAALRAHLEALRADASRRDTLGRLGRERVLAHYTQAQIAAQTVALYRELVADGG